MSWGVCPESGQPRGCAKFHCFQVEALEANRSKVVDLHFTSSFLAFFFKKSIPHFLFSKKKKTYDLSVMLMHSLTADLSTGPIPVKSLTGLFRDQIFANKYIRRDNQEHCAARNKETEAANCGSCPTHTLTIPLRGNIRLSSEGRLWKICVDVNHSVFESW